MQVCSCVHSCVYVFHMYIPSFYVLCTFRVLGDLGFLLFLCVLFPGKYAFRFINTVLIFAAMMWMNPPPKKKKNEHDLLKSHFSFWTRTHCSMCIQQSAFQVICMCNIINDVPFAFLFIFVLLFVLHLASNLN